MHLRVLLRRTRRWPTSVRAHSVPRAAIVAALIAVISATPHGANPKGTAVVLVTDRDSLPLSNNFGPPTLVRLGGNGDTYVVENLSSLLRWTGGTRTQLLKTGGAFPGFPNRMTDFIGGTVDVNASGHASIVTNFDEKDQRQPAGLFVYDGAGFQKVALTGESTPGISGKVFAGFGQQQNINNSDQVAFIGFVEPITLLDQGLTALYVGSPTSTPQLIAYTGQSAPLSVGGTYGGIQLIDINGTGEVAFVATINGGFCAPPGIQPTNVFLWTPIGGVQKVADTCDGAPGTPSGLLSLFLNAANYDLNDLGEVAFLSNVRNDAATTGIFIGTTSSTQKIVVNTDDIDDGVIDTTPGPGGGTFDGGLTELGLNNSGQVLFRSNPVGTAGGNNQALFVKDALTPATVVMARNLASPGGPLFQNVQQGLLNNAGDVAFLATLQGPQNVGWFHWNGSTPATSKIVDETTTVAGGTFGLLNPVSVNAQFNDAGQLAFIADILGPSGVGAFRATPGAPWSIDVLAHTGEVLPAGSDPVFRFAGIGASDDVVAFVAFRPGGRFAVFTKPIQATKGKGITRIVGEGDVAPGIGGIMWGLFANSVVINDNEQMAVFMQTIVGAGTYLAPIYPASAYIGYAPGTGLQKIVATFDPAPGVPAGATFGNLGTAGALTSINASGQIAFQASVTGGPGQAGVFIASAIGGVQAIARIGGASPVGGTFNNFNQNVSLNDAGQVVFQANSFFPGPPAVFVGSASSAPVKLVAVGDTLPGAGGTVSNVPTLEQINNGGQVAYVVNFSPPGPAQGIYLGTAGGAQNVVALTGGSTPIGGTFNSFENIVEVNNSGNVAFWSGISGASPTSAYFVYTGAVSTRLFEGQTLPGGGTAGFLQQRGGVGNARANAFELAETGEISMNVDTVNGAPNLRRAVIADGSGGLRGFVTTGDRFSVNGVNSTVATLSPAGRANSTGRFVTGAALVDGTAKWAVLIDGSRF